LKKLSRCQQEHDCLKHIISSAIALMMIERSFDGTRPTDWHSVAASAPGEASQNANDLARAAVNCNAGLGG
jgi:hypothetical protein